MNIYQSAAWSIIAGLSLLLVGGLVLWAYGARHPQEINVTEGLECEATQRFHLRLSRWFFLYGLVVMAAGLGLLIWAAPLFL